MPTSEWKQSGSNIVREECSMGGLMTDLSLMCFRCRTEMLPVVGTHRTNDWYSSYRCLVRRLPTIGTKTIHAVFVLERTNRIE
ncbi:MAG: hypothetical protein SPI30_06730 [Prevotella sp.]|nr:hypothetical protein [Prevotella sp.]